MLVVGGGVFGVTAALALRARGHTVTLLERGPPPHPDASSTDISKVIRADYGADVDYTAWMERALEVWRAWNDEAPLFFETGVTFATRGPMAEGSFERDSFELLTVRGFPLERLERGAHARFGAWAHGFDDGYFNPRGGWAPSGRVVAHLARRAVEAGVVLREGVARRVCIENDRAVGVETDDETIAAGAVLVAAGAWSAKLVPALAPRFVVVGQPVLHFAPADLAPFEPPRFTPFGADISRTGFYGFCANEGVVKVAYHGAGEARDPDAARALADGTEARFRDFLAGAVPALATAPIVGSRICLYADSVDGDPWIDRVPGVEGLTVACGGSGHGFKLAPLLGDWIADAVETGTAPARFRWRALREDREQARYDA